MYSILKKYIEVGKIYPVFAGGDDCFLVGAWNEVFEIALIIQKAFDEFQKKEAMNVTISAGLVVVNPKFPMVRLAEEAEHSLEMAKKYIAPLEQKAEKNKIAIFGEVLTWEEYAKAQKIAFQLQDLIINKGESRGMLEVVKSSEIGYNSLQRQSQKGIINFPKVWRLKYYLRNVKTDNEKEMEEIFKSYEEALIHSVMKKESTNPAVFPVAARWAELLTKNTEKENSHTLNN